ncbi:hypothetical protein ACWGKR_24445 [Bacillus thuringiensis]|uniref:hypothetical protein n=1 Tax=Bacillus thuringiensis TaxID=1428 RepID=UPI0035E19D53
MKEKIELNKSIHSGCYVEIIPPLYRNEPFDGPVIKNEALNIYYNLQTDTCCDRSDIAGLNIEFQDGVLEILEVLNVKNPLYYTHIVKDKGGYIYAAEIKEGDWTEQFLD